MKQAGPGPVAQELVEQLSSKTVAHIVSLAEASATTG
jgi:hypothetical protein